MELLFAGFAHVLSRDLGCPAGDRRGDAPETRARRLTAMAGRSVSAAPSDSMAGRRGSATGRSFTKADLAVQFAGRSTRRASGAVSDCIAARVPMIVSAIGWATELPERMAFFRCPDCSIARLGERMVDALWDQDLRAGCGKPRTGTPRHSFARVAERYVDVLDSVRSHPWRRASGQRRGSSLTDQSWGTSTVRWSGCGWRPLP